MSTASKSRTETLDEFLLDYLPWGTDQSDHDLLKAMIEAARAYIAKGLRERGALRAEDQDNQPGYC